MQLVVQQKFYDNANFTTKLVGGASDILSSLNYIVRNVFSYLLLLVFSPVILLGIVFSLVCIFLVNRLLGYMIYSLKKSEPIDASKLSASEYKNFRQNSRILNQNVENLKLITGQLEDVPFLLKNSVRLINEMLGIFQEIQVENENFLKTLDSPLNEYNGFEVITEEELWNERPIAYEYLV